MQGSSGTRRGFVHLFAGAALGAAIVVVLWIYSGGKPFGEVVGAGDVSAPTPAVVQKTPVQQRTDASPATAAKLRKAPPSLGGGSGQLQFSKPAAKRAAKAERTTKAKRKPRRARRKAVRVVAPPAEPAEQMPVAVVPSPAPTAAPAPPAPTPSGGAGKPVKRRAPALSVGAGEG